MRYIQGVVREADRVITGTLSEIDRTIIGILHDKNKTLSATADALTYRDYFTVDLVFLIKARQILADIAKAMQIDDGFQIRGNDMSMVSAKEATFEDMKFAIADAFQAALLYAIKVIDEMAMEINIQSVWVRKPLSLEEAQMVLASAVDSFVSKSLYATNNFAISESFSTTVLKDAGVKNVLSILSEIAAQARKFAWLGSKQSIAESLEIVSIRFRFMEDIYDLEMEDIYDLTMDELYMITEN